MKSFKEFLAEAWEPKVGDKVTVKNYQGLGRIHSIPKAGIARILFDDHSERAEVPFHHLKNRNAQE